MKDLTITEALSVGSASTPGQQFLQL
jgi:hypothetical protein